MTHSAFAFDLDVLNAQPSAAAAAAVLRERIERAADDPTTPSLQRLLQTSAERVPTRVRAATAKSSIISVDLSETTFELFVGENGGRVQGLVFPDGVVVLVDRGWLVRTSLFIFFACVGRRFGWITAAYLLCHGATNPTTGILFEDTLFALVHSFDYKAAALTADAVLTFVALHELGHHHFDKGDRSFCDLLVANESWQATVAHAKAIDDAVTRTSDAEAGCGSLVKLTDAAFPPWRFHGRSHTVFSTWLDPSFRRRRLMLPESDEHEYEELVADAFAVLTRCALDARESLDPARIIGREPWLPALDWMLFYVDAQESALDPGLGIWRARHRSHPHAETRLGAMVFHVLSRADQSDPRAQGWWNAMSEMDAAIWGPPMTDALRRALILVGRDNRVPTRAARRLPENGTAERAALRLLLADADKPAPYGAFETLWLFPLIETLTAALRGNSLSPDGRLHLEAQLDALAINQMKVLKAQISDRFEEAVDFFAILEELAECIGDVGYRFRIVGVRTTESGGDHA
jgi:hypothetical protein